VKHIGPIAGDASTTGLGFDHLLGTYCTNGSPSFLQVLQDEGPSATMLDNLVVNGIVIDDKQGSDK
jgi:hypothetical protein